MLLKCVINKRTIARKGQNTSCKSNKKTSDKFNNYINKKQQVQTTVLVNIRMSVVEKRKISYFCLARNLIQH